MVGNAALRTFYAEHRFSIPGLRAELLNPGARVWRGGLNLTDSLSTDSEAILTIGPTRSADWWSYLPQRTSQIFVRVDPDARANT